MAHNLRIVPAKTGSPDAIGTEVWCGSEKLLQVQSVTIHASAKGGKWIATIEAWAELDGEIVAEQSDGA